MSQKIFNGRCNIRHRSDGRWEARYTEGRDPGTGKQIQHSICGATQNEVRQKMVQTGRSETDDRENEQQR